MPEFRHPYGTLPPYVLCHVLIYLVLVYIYIRIQALPFLSSNINKRELHFSVESPHILHQRVVMYLNIITPLYLQILASKYNPPDTFDSS